MGKTRADVMPPITTNERWAAWVDSLNFSLFGLVQSFIIFVFFVGDVLMSGRLILVGVLAIYDRCRRRTRSTRITVLPSPCSSRLTTKRRLSNALCARCLESDYPKLRVIVIDDGSQDATLEVTRAAFARRDCRRSGYRADQGRTRAKPMRSITDWSR